MHLKLLEATASTFKSISAETTYYSEPGSTVRGQSC